MSDDDKKPQEATYTSENGRVRAYYRTIPNAEDEFNRALIVSEYVANNGRANVPVKIICEFAMATFCTRLELLDEKGAVTSEHPFAMDLLKTLTGPYAESGWPAELAFTIYRDVLDKTARRIEDVKKTSESASPLSTPASSPPAAPSGPTRT